jgi:plastocyanin
VTRSTAIGRLTVAVLVAATTAWSSRPARRNIGNTSRVIRVSQFAFDPAETRVTPGDTIVWENADILAHTTAADSGAWSSGDIAVGARFVFVAADTGRYAYHCASHPTMHGVLVVK